VRLRVPRPQLPHVCSSRTCAACHSAERRSRSCDVGIRIHAYTDDHALELLGTARHVDRPDPDLRARDAVRGQKALNVAPDGAERRLITLRRGRQTSAKHRGRGHRARFVAAGDQQLHPAAGLRRHNRSMARGQRRPIDGERRVDAAASGRADDDRACRVGTTRQRQVHRRCFEGKPRGNVRHCRKIPGRGRFGLHEVHIYVVDDAVAVSILEEPARLEQRVERRMRRRRRLCCHTRLHDGGRKRRDNDEPGEHGATDCTGHGTARLQLTYPDAQQDHRRAGLRNGAVRRAPPICRGRAGKA